MPIVLLDKHPHFYYPDPANIDADT